jgi:DNA polymerase I-like protein with 3'-5' exonuclease and polymerase domains
MRIVFSEKDLYDLVSHIQETKMMCFDVETMGDHRGDPWRNDVVWISVSDGSESWTIPMGHPNGEYIESQYPLRESAQKRIEKGLPLRPSDYSTDIRKEIRIFSEAPDQLTRTEVFSALKSVFLDDSIIKVGHNLAFDLGSVTKYVGEVPVGPYADTMIAAFLVDSSKAYGFGLKDVAKKYANISMEKGVGAEIEKYSLTEVAEYAGLDALATAKSWAKLSTLIERDNLSKVFSLEMDVLRIVTEMRLSGATIDTDTLNELKARLEKDIEATKGRIYLVAGEQFNINSTATKQRLLFGKKKDNGRGLAPKMLTTKGKEKHRAGETLSIADYSVSSEALEIYRLSDPLVDALLEYSDYNKLHSTYVIPYLGGMTTRVVNGKPQPFAKEALLDKGKLHTDFNQIGAATGRFSCVSGDTLLPTNRGTFTFEEYLPEAGDMVMTHRGRWMSVVRKIYKGEDPMFRVVLDNGSFLHCTMDHRLLTLSGWVRLADLHVGDEVASYVGIQEICEQLGESGSRNQCLYCGGKTDRASGSKTTTNNSSEHSIYSGEVFRSEEVSGRKSTAVLSVKSRREQPYAGQEWFPAPQLCGACYDRRWLHPNQGGEEVRSGASASNGSDAWGEESSTRLGSPSHRRGQDEQRSRQSSVSDESRPSATSRTYSTIREVTALGTMGVWDIEVAGDHSYLAQGFVNHNSRNPNLQNVPSPGSEYGKLIRNLFIAPEGCQLVVADYSQIEPRTIASFSKDPVMMDTYINGGDIYTAIGDTMGVDRKAGKVLVLSIAYGVGPDKISRQIGCTPDEAKTLLNDFSSKFKNITKLQSLTIRTARSKAPIPYVATLTGRRRYLPDLKSSVRWQVNRAERQAFNTLIQGSAADIMKIAMVRAYQQIPERSYLILTIHDELVTVTPKDIAEETAEAVRAAMEGVSVLDVPLVADVKIVDRWGEAK